MKDENDSHPFSAQHHMMFIFVEVKKDYSTNGLLSSQHSDWLCAALSNTIDFFFRREMVFSLRYNCGVLRRFSLHLSDSRSPGLSSIS